MILSLLRLDDNCLSSLSVNSYILNYNTKMRLIMLQGKEYSIILNTCSEYSSVSFISKLMTCFIQCNDLTESILLKTNVVR